MRILPAVVLALTLAPSSIAQPSGAAAELLAPHGIGRFPALYVRALDDFIVAEDLYRQGAFERCLARLERLWADHPPGTDEWAACRGDVDLVFVGSPPCYYGLRMLTEAARFRVRDDVESIVSHPVTLTVVLVGRSEGREPRDFDELARGDGRRVKHTLEPTLLEQDHAVLHESLTLFREYMHAATGGRLDVRTNVTHLGRLSVPVHATSDPMRVAGLADGAWQKIWTAVPDEVRAATDWWWVIYPSHVPERHPAFATTEFITGGMGVGPDGGSPCFIIDDRWLTRKPPHLGRGPYSSVERRAYLPQWLQHEFFHHLFRVYPRFELEKTGHQWFDRTSWPDDFVGRIEPDYYDEALHRRLQQAEPPMHVHLRYAAPPKGVLARVRPEAMVGDYRHEPLENDWHRGTIERAGTRKGAPILRWRNAAGVAWELIPDLEHGVLRTGPDNPYYSSGASGGRDFHVALRRGADGEFVAEVIGFRFQGSFYALTRPE